MALSSNNGSGGVKFINIVKGKFAVRLQDGDDNPDAVERTLEAGDNEGSVVRELHYDNVEGEITGAKIEETQYGQRLDIDLYDSDVDETYVIQMGVTSSYFQQFAKRVPNLKPTGVVFIGLGHDKDKDRNFLYMKQNDLSVKFAFTKDEPNGLPAPTKKKKQGKDVWNFEEQDEYLYQLVEEWTRSFGGSENQDETKKVESVDDYDDSQIPF